MNQPLVSIIIPNYNHYNYLTQRLESVFNQTFQNFEVILLDDCSTDNSRDILTEYAKNSKVSHCIFNKVNSGNTFVQWNKGIELAKGAYIWIAESDDFCEVNFLELVLEPMIKNKEIVLSYCQSNRTNEKGEVTGTWLNHTYELNSQLFLTNFIIEGNEFIENFLIYKNVIPNASAVIFLKERAVQIGELNYEIDLRLTGDWLFYIKLITKNKLSFISKSLNNFRYHDNSVIAKAKERENLLKTNSIYYFLRKKIHEYIKSEEPFNYKVILKKNRKIIRELNYEEYLYYFRNKKYLRGFILLIKTLDIFFRKRKIKRKIKYLLNINQ